MAIFDEVPIIIGMPRNAIKADITVTIMEGDEDEIVKAVKHLSIGDIRDLRNDFKEFIGDDWDALYELTEEARNDMLNRRQEMSDE